MSIDMIEKCGLSEPIAEYRTSRDAIEARHRKRVAALESLADDEFYDNHDLSLLQMEREMAELDESWYREHPDDRPDAAYAAEVAQHEADEYAEYEAEMDALLAAHNAEIAEAIAEARVRDYREAITKGAYVDVSALLAGDLKTPEPTVGIREDSQALFYPGAVNAIIGESENGKTLALTAVACDVLFSGGSVLWIDLDHNGAAATLARFRSFGASVEVLSNPSRFRFSEAEDPAMLDRVIADAARWKPTLSAVDSMGELLALYGANFKAEEDFIPVNNRTLVKLAKAGSCVIYIDHLTGSEANANAGATGTKRKKMAIDGLMVMGVKRREFTRTSGGKMDLRIIKDRHGKVRDASPEKAKGEKQQLAATFELMPINGGSHWKFWKPWAESAASPSALSDVDMVHALNPAPTSGRDVKSRLGWGSDRANGAFKAWQARTHGEGMPAA